MDIREFIDLAELEGIQSAWSNATGLASVFVDDEGEILTKEYNFTDYRVNKTKGTEEGIRRLADVEQNALASAGVESGCYPAYDGLIDFTYPIALTTTGEVVMVVKGGQVLSADAEVDEAQIRRIAREIGINEDKYVEAIATVPTLSEEKIVSSADLLGMIVNQFVNMKYTEYVNSKKMNVFSSDLEKINGVINRMEENSKKLTKIASKQGILALNSAIEAARLGTAGASFSILAKQESDLSKQSGDIYAQIGEDIVTISEAANEMNYASEHDGNTAPAVDVDSLLAE